MASSCADWAYVYFNHSNVIGDLGLDHCGLERGQAVVLLSRVFFLEPLSRNPFLVVTQVQKMRRCNHPSRQAVTRVTVDVIPVTFVPHVLQWYSISGIIIRMWFVPEAVLKMWRGPVRTIEASSEGA